MSILIAAIDDLPMVMRMTVPDADDPAAAKSRYGRGVQHCAAGLTPFRCYITYYYLDRTLAISAGMRLRGLAPAPVEQRTGRRHAGRRWGGLGATDPCQRADGQRGLCPRQRSNICCSLSHLGGFALHQFVHILAQLIDVRAQEAFGCLSIISAA